VGGACPDTCQRYCHTARAVGHEVGIYGIPSGYAHSESSQQGNGYLEALPNIVSPGSHQLSELVLVANEPRKYPAGGKFSVEMAHSPIDFT
jgi:hypothetical protein